MKGHNAIQREQKINDLFEDHKRGQIGLEGLRKRIIRYVINVEEL